MQRRLNRPTIAIQARVDYRLPSKTISRYTKPPFPRSGAGFAPLPFDAGIVYDLSARLQEKHRFPIRGIRSRRSKQSPSGTVFPTGSAAGFQQTVLVMKPQGTLTAAYCLRLNRSGSSCRQRRRHYAPSSSLSSLSISTVSPSELLYDISLMEVNLCVVLSNANTVQSVPALPVGT